MTSKMLKAALYARVSTEKQIDNFSINAQVTCLKQYCKDNNIIIYDIYVDEGVSGTKEFRKGLQNLLSNSKNFDIVLVHKFDRFARKVELSEKIKRQLKENNVKVISITEPIENSPIGFFQEGLLSLLSEYYIKNLATEIKKGMLQRVIDGHYNGSVPFGYCTKNKKLYIKEDEAVIVKKIYELYLQGYSSNMIAEWCRKNNIFTQNKKIFRGSTVTKILHNIKYIGKLKYEGKIYDGIHESILDTETFDKVQEIHRTKHISKNYSNNKRGINYQKYYLIEILYCGECGSNFRANNTGPSKSRFATYACSAATNYSGIGKCDFTKGFNVKKFETEFENLLKDIIKRTVKINITQATPLSSDLEIAKQRLKNIDKELKRNKQAYLSGVFDLEEFKEIKTNLEHEKKELEKKLLEPHKQNIDYDDFVSRLQNSILALKKLDNACDKRNVLKKVIDKVYIYRSGRIEIVITS
jgi:site-specific DNA recombinase